MNELVVLPDPDDVAIEPIQALRERAVAVVDWSQTADNIVIVNDQRRASGALQQLVDDRETIQQLQRAARWLEVACGRLLGMDERSGQGKRNDLLLESERLFSGADVHRFRQLARWTVGKHRHDEIVALVDAGAARGQILRRIAELTPRTRNGDTPGWAEPERYVIVNADFREYCKQIPDRAIDLIVTDPPYPEEHIPLVGDLAAMAKRVLAPRGLLLVVTGKINLPLVMDQLSRHLTYGWVFCLDLPGANTRIMGRHLMQMWKPILAYSTGTWPSEARWHGDRVTSPAKAQTEFAWAQNAEPMRELIRRFSRPNAVVLDPMCGAGSYGAAALMERRRFIGIDGHSEPAALAEQRLAELE